MVAASPSGGETGRGQFQLPLPRHPFGNFPKTPWPKRCLGAEHQIAAAERLPVLLDQWALLAQGSISTPFASAPFRELPQNTLAQKMSGRGTPDRRRGTSTRPFGPVGPFGQNLVSFPDRGPAPPLAAICNHFRCLVVPRVHPGPVAREQVLISMLVIPQTDLSVGVLAVCLLSGWMVCGRRRASTPARFCAQASKTVMVRSLSPTRNGRSHHFC